MTEAVAFVTFFAAIPALGFVVIYARVPWYKSLVGRGVMMQAAGLTQLVGMGVLRVFFGATYAAKQPLLLVVYSEIGIGLWVMFIALLLVRRDQREQLLRELGKP